MSTIDTLLASALAAIPPGWVLALVLAGINIFVFHVVVGGEQHSALYFAPWGIFGFALGNLLASLANPPLPMLGDLHLIEASIAAWAALSIANARPRPTS